MKNLNIFKKIVIFLFLPLLFLGTFFVLNNKVSAQESEVVNIHFFYGTGCPHCAKEEIFLEKMSNIYGEKIEVKEYEIYYNLKNQNLLNKVIDYFKISVAGVPITVVGEEYFIGYGGDETTGVQIQNEIVKCIEEGCIDEVQKLLSRENNEGDNTSEPKLEDVSPIYLNIPFLGKINLKSFSLPIATIIIAFLDGFNPCAMWILLFLITMLINMKDRKKLYILGSIFIITSGLVYFVFLAAWLNLFKFIGFVYWVRILIGVVAIFSGVLHIKDALKSKGGCKATNEKKRESIMERIKRIVSEKSFLLSILGIITLAVSVNLIEVVCSAGLPAIYTSLLSTVPLTTSEYYLYLILYIIIFMLDDLVVFFIAIKTFEVTGIAKKYTKWSSLIGGIVIFILGIILVLKPELLMFG